MDFFPEISFPALSWSLRQAEAAHCHLRQSNGCHPVGNTVSRQIMVFLHSQIILYNTTAGNNIKGYMVGIIIYIYIIQYIIKCVVSPGSSSVVDEIVYIPPY